MTETSMLSCVRFVSQHNKRYVPTIFCEALEVRRNDAFRVKLGGFVAHGGLRPQSLKDFGSFKHAKPPLHMTETKRVRPAPAWALASYTMPRATRAGVCVDRAFVCPSAIEPN